MKYRVVEKIYKDGSSKFFPQRKFFLFWHYFYDWDWDWEDCEVVKVSYYSLDRAKEHIRAEIRSIEKSTSISKKVYPYEYSDK